jgi:photosystem II stability/assembly factor-like uncharacterized protein
VAIDPQHPSVMSAGSVHATAKSTPTINQWVSFGPDGGPMSALAVDPSDPTIVYAGSEAGAAYKSWTSGARWQRLEGGLPELGFGALAIDPVAPETLYAGTGGSGIYKTVDGGFTWADSNLGIPQDLRFVFDLAVDPSTPRRLYVLVGDDGYGGGALFVSTDGAATWGPSSLPGGGTVVAVDPADPEHVYVGGWRSDDGGATWSAMTWDDQCTCGIVRGFAFDGGTPGVIFAGLDQGLIYRGSVQRSHDWGATWGEVLGTDPVESIATSPAAATTPAAVYVGTGQYADGQVYRSIDGGDTWSSASAGLPTGQVKALAPSPIAPDVLYAASVDGGVSLTRDGGLTWSLRNHGLDEETIHALAVSPSHPSIVYAGTDVYLSGNGVHRGSRAGRRWGPTSPGLTYDGPVKAIAVDPTDPDLIFVAVNDYCDACDEGAIDLSMDGGETWVDVSPDTGPMEDVAIDPFDSNTVYVAAVSSPTGMYKSVDGGLTWENSGFDDSYVTALAMDPTTPGVIHAGTAADGVYTSTDGGASWRGSGLPAVFVNDLAVSPTNPSVIYASSRGDTRVWRTIDGGSTWSPVDDDIPEGVAVWGLAVDPLDPDHVFVGTEGAGVYATTDAGATWSALNEGLGNLSVFTLAIDPRGRVLYAGTGPFSFQGPGHGVYQLRLG